MVERRHDTSDRRVVLVNYAPGVQDMAHRMMEGRRLEEARAVLKGLKLLVGSFSVAEKVR